jgi:phage recombination protein Bet
MTTKELTVQQAFTTEQLDIIKSNVAKGATDQELAYFLEIAKASGLNPITKEVWFIKTNAGPQIMTGINGFWRIANEHEEFDGAEETLEHDAQGNLVSATCKIYRKDRKYPTIGIALLKEYKKGSPIWNSMPSVMLGKCAASVAIRKAFPLRLNGLYTKEEMPEQDAIDMPSAPIKVTVAPKEYLYKIPQPDPDASDEDFGKFKAICDFMTQCGCTYDPDADQWSSQRELKKAVKYLVTK